MFRRGLVTAVFLFFYPAILSQISYASNKSVFVINSHDGYEVQAYHIDDDNVTLQATATLPATSHLIDLAAWPQKELLFVTHETSETQNPTSITYISTKTLVTVGQLNTGSLMLEFAGIVVDTGKGKVYAAKRNSNNLYVYLWNDAQKTLVFDSNHILTNIGLYGAFDLALDANGSLYVSDGTQTIHDYNTTTWQLADSFNIVVGSTARNAVGIAIDPNRRYLYSGDYLEGAVGDTHLVRTKLSDHTSDETSVGNGVMVVGIDVDKATGLVYCTTSNNDFRVYNSNLVLQDTKTSGIGGTAGVAVGGLYVPPIVRNITKDNDINYTTIQSAIDDANNNDTLVASEGYYHENPDFDGKHIILKSIDPNNWSVVDNTRIYGSVSLSSCPNKSTISGLTITDSGGNGISCNNAKLTINHCRIRNNAGRGIGCLGSTNATITDTYINNNGKDGIYATTTGSNLIIDINRCEIAHNKYNGIEIQNGTAIIKNNIIHHNAMCYDEDENYQLTYGIHLGVEKAFDVRNNTIVDNNNGGICTDSNGDPNIYSNIVWGNNYGDLIDPALTKVYFNCIKNYTGDGNNITSDPCFRDAGANNFHLKYNSPCIDKGDPCLSFSTTEIDIDGESRVIDGNGTLRVDMGADEYYICSGKIDVYPNPPDGIVNFLDFAVLAKAWLTHPGNGNNDIVDYVDDNMINKKDLKEFCNCWLYKTGNYESGIKMQMMILGDSISQNPSELVASQQSEDESAGSLAIADTATELTAESQEEQQPSEEQSFMPDYNLPAIYLTCDVNTPEPNDEVTIWVHSDTPLLAMGIGIYIIGDMNITSAMNEADCNSFSWDNGWNSDPYIDPNGWVYLSGVKWVADANGTVGYVKFRYHSGQVSVYIDQEYSEAFAFDWDSQYSSYVSFSQETLYIRDPNEP